MTRDPSGPDRQGGQRGLWPDWLVTVLPQRLWPVMILVLAGLAVLVITGYAVSDRLDDARNAQSENTTWLVAQVEVEALKMMLALERAGADAETGLQPLRRSFDIYFSRVGVVDRYMAGSPILSPLREMREWQEVGRITDRLQAMLDVPDAVLVPSLPKVIAEAGALRQPLRAFTMNALSLLVKAGIEGREGLVMLLTRIAEVGLALIALLTGIVWIMVQLSRHLRLRNLEVETARANLESTLGATFDGVIVLRPDGRITDANPAAQALFGFARKALLGRDLLALLDCGEVDLSAQLAQGRLQVPRVEVTARRADGQAVPLELSLTAARDPAGQPIRFAFLRDVSDRHRHEQSLRAARDAALIAADAKMRFLAMMSHEMRTPLNGVIAALDIVLRTGSPTTRQMRFLKIAERSAGLALDQINDVLDQARQDDSFAPEAAVGLNMTALVADLSEQVMPLARRGGNVIQLDLPPRRKAWIHAPRRELTRVLMNLVGNAAKFTRNGEIRILVRLEPDKTPGRQILRVDVADTGFGIASDRIETIFDPFERLDNGYDREAEGTGLGLGIARRSVERMGGTIHAESVPGQGSLFRVEMPVATARAAPQPALAPRTNTPLKRQDVLIAEDNPTNRLLLREMLQHLGQRVTEAKDGAEAIARAQERAFALILMDVSMPKVDGLAATRAIRSGGGPSAHARIVALTAHDTPDVLDRFRKADLTDVLQKPVTLSLLRPLLAAEAIPPSRLADTVLDRAIIRDLVGLVSPEDLARTLATLRAEAARFADKLRQPDAGLAQEAHRLQGAVAMLGAGSLAALLRDIETAAQGGRALPPPELFETRWVEADQALTDMLAAVHQGAATESGPL